MALGLAAALVLVLLLDGGVERVADGQTTELPTPAELGGPAPEDRPAPGQVVDGPTCMTDAGCIAWQLRLGGWRDVVVDPEPGLTMAGDLLLLPRVGGARAIDLRTGATRWSHDLLDLVMADSPPSGVAVAGDLALLGGLAGTLTALELGEGTLHWSTTVDVLAGISEAAVGDGQLFVAGPSARSEEGGAYAVVALDASDGTVRWTRQADQVALTRLGPVLAESFVRLGRLDPSTGDPAWEQALSAPAPGLTGVGPTLIVDDDAGRRLLDAASGEVLVELAAAPAPGLQAPEPPVVVAGPASATLIEVDGVAWTVRMPGADCCAGSQVTTDDVELHLSDQSTLIVDRATGAILSSRAAADVGGAFAWRVGDLLLVSDAVGADGVAEVGLRDAASGRNIARVSGAWPAVTPDGGVLLVAPGWIARIGPSS